MDGSAASRSRCFGRWFDDRRPSDVAFTVLHEHVEERVERMESPLVGDLAEGLADE